MAVRFRCLQYRWDELAQVFSDQLSEVHPRELFLEIENLPAQDAQVSQNHFGIRHGVRLSFVGIEQHLFRWSGLRSL
jgi:hypothetical protein